MRPLPGIAGWEAWGVLEFATNTTSWHGRPVGAPHAVVHASSLDGLAAAADEWLGRAQDEVDAAVRELRRKHDAMPEHWHGEREHLRRRIETELTGLLTGGSE
jgi:hypothetical protein